MLRRRAKATPLLFSLLDVFSLDQLMLTQNSQLDAYSKYQFKLYKKKYQVCVPR